MADVIWGNIIRVIDSDTFDIEVTGARGRNRSNYSFQEQIRVVGVNTSTVFMPVGLMAAPQLHRRLLGSSVRCNIRTRDLYGRLICSISLNAPVVYPFQYAS